MRKLVMALLLLVIGAVAAVGVILTWDHIEVRREGAPVPTAADVAAVGKSGDGPVRLSWIDTARQRMPRSAVLDVAKDPTPDAPYLMSHPSFVLEWADGRLLLVDVGMTHDGAVKFGELIGMLGTAEPMEPLRATADALGAARSRVGGVIFTHLHEDHTGGLDALCSGGPAAVPIFMTPAQQDVVNYTTRASRDAVMHAPCARPTRLEGGSLLDVPGFPGVAVFHAAGHTPGSQIVFARVAGKTYAFIGDIVNNGDGITHDIPKPYYYSLLIVPESTERLQALREYLRDLGTRAGVTLLVSHDEQQIRSTGIPEWK
ncbi:MAG TPA: MBL fold metallo-hydrolase [Candidatus Binatia bacterium]|nr:MBL fold metallo-hydrolase [Candidatus Binatia bacterium]